MKTLHFHAVTRILGIDIVGVVEKESNKELDCILRSPGLRPRHWAFISESLPGSGPHKELDVVFPHRFTSRDDDDDEEWDALDQEETEAMKEISSASKVRRLDEISVADYPRFVIKNFHLVQQGARVEHLLKILLPLSKVVFKKQQSDKERAKIASELREKEEFMKKKQTEMNEREAFRYEL